MNPFKMNDQDLITAFSAAALPLLVSLCLDKRWSKTVRALVGLSVIIIFSICRCWYLGHLTIHDFLSTFMASAVISWTAFRNLWKPTIAPAIEAKSSDLFGAKIKNITPPEQISSEDQIGLAKQFITPIDLRFNGLEIPANSLISIDQNGKTSFVVMTEVNSPTLANSPSEPAKPVDSVVSEENK